MTVPRLTGSVDIDKKVKQNLSCLDFREYDLEILIVEGFVIVLYRVMEKPAGGFSRQDCVLNKIHD
jgi:hypothetical protein